MNAGDPLTSSDVSAILLALWEARGQDVPMRELLRQTSLPLPSAQAALDALTARGCRIERSPAGVSLATVDLSTWRELLLALARLRPGRLGRNVLVYPEIDSTNDAAWQVAAAPDADGTVVLANHQTAGRGRLGRQWQARPNQSVLLSVILHGIPAASMDRLTLLTGLATAVALERAVAAMQGSMQRLDIKWPNDILWNGRKLAGLLVETRKLPSPDRAAPAIDAVVLGIGINIAQGTGDFPPELADKSASLFQAAGILLDRMRVIESLLATLDDYLKSEPRNAWIAEWKDRCALLGRQLTLRTGDRTITGQVLDIDPLQGLLLRDHQGITHFLSARTCSIS